MNNKLIYFDNINSTFPDPEIISVVKSTLESGAGNPSSHIHSAGILAGQILDKARENVAALIGADADAIIFTSGATESNNLAISGFMKAYLNYRLVVSEIEHYSIINQARKFKSEGRDVVFLKVNETGLIDLSCLESALKAGPALVSISPANPEIGTIQDIERIGQICRAHNAILHYDATAAASILQFDTVKMGIGLLTLSGHNMYAPMGIGALYVSRQIRIAPIFDGGNQQMGIRPGTENLSGAAALGVASKLILSNREKWNEDLTTLGQKLWNSLA